MCIFCQVVSGELPSHKIYEDDNILAFLDIHPAATGHTLIIPKKHYQNLEEIPENELSYLMSVVKKIGLMVKQNLGVEGYNVCENNDLVAGQEIPHIHFHIVPRVKGDGLSSWPKNGYEAGEAENVLKQIRGENK